MFHDRNPSFRFLVYSGRWLTVVSVGTPPTTTGVSKMTSLADIESRQAELLDVRAVAELLACSKRHVYRLSDAGRMPRPVALGRLIRWRRAELLNWVNDGCPPVRTVRGAGR
jgi:excisionase family DNA binding protein